ncbi:MAG: hypothetical protein V4633_06765 [Pseudomonadota bacterium]
MFQMFRIFRIFLAVLACPLCAGAADAPPAALGKPVATEQLAHARGGNNTTSQAGTVSGNSATQVVTGNNVIQAGSFAGMAGIPIVVQNSGANVLIQNATIINLQLQ